MRVVFFDKLRETYKSVENIVQLENTMIKSNGRLTSCWLLIETDGTTKTFKQKDFSIYRIEG